MPANLENNVHIPDRIRRIYTEIGVSPIMLLKNYALNQIHGRIQKYEAENEFFKRKYGSDFETFKGRVESMENDENFDWEDDLMDWEFAATNLRYWQKKVHEITAE